MKLVGIIQEDFVNYRKPGMLLEFPYCSFKCNKDAGYTVCQNLELSGYEVFDFDINEIIEAYKANPLTESVIFQGLEPFDSFYDMMQFITAFRSQLQDDIVIYTGYIESEIYDKLNNLREFENVYVKFGRFKPNNEPHFDKVLQVNLSSDNQYGIKIS